MIFYYLVLIIIILQTSLVASAGSVFPDDYDLICEIDTHNLDEAMSLAQNIDFSNSIHNNLRSSATVGDIFETENDGSYVVAPVGFKSLDTNTIFDPTSTKSIIMNQHPTGRKS